MHVKAECIDELLEVLHELVLLREHMHTSLDAGVCRSIENKDDVEACHQKVHEAEEERTQLRASIVVGMATVEHPLHLFKPDANLALDCGVF